MEKALKVIISIMIGCSVAEMIVSFVMFSVTKMVVTLFWVPLLVAGIVILFYALQYGDK